ncbi:MAG: 16S rRNA (adenine(1518)-N(6)/adenine(1519)-N(6))-dimethyltransferase RsmA [bacterium]|nr:16S rRNA (adenine(1518)-N(6)/adenine(1519)-N(6))-dimethyltransferase RsmA [bacterium]
MNLFEPRTIRNLLKKYRIRPSRRFGQNFLVGKGTVKKIIETAELNEEDTVLEIGPGVGTITQELSRKARKVIAVEKDRNMVEILGETLENFKNIEVIREDILKLKLKFPPRYKVVANLPFYITSPVIRHFLEAGNENKFSSSASRLAPARRSLVEEGPQQMVLVVQKEVGQRICARPPKMSILAVSVQVYAEAKVVGYIPKKNFWPEPKVDAALIKITPRKRPLKPGINSFFKIMKAGFSQPRKQLINNLSKGLDFNRVKVENWLKENNIQPNQRAETLEVEDWINLAKSFKIN